MMITRRFLLTLVLFLPLRLFAQSDDNVLLLQPNDAVPPAARKLDKAIKVIDQGFKINCTYEDIVSEAKMKVRKAGGNILKVNTWRVPNSLSTCYGLKGEAYFTDDLAGLRRSIAQRADSIERSLVPDGARYAMLYVYRPNGIGPLVSYNLHLGDSIICRVRNEKYYAIRLDKEGPANLWTRTEVRVDVPIDIHFGKVYFLKCGVNMGAFVGHPMMRFVDPKVGIDQFRFDRVSSQDSTDR